MIVLLARGQRSGRPDERLRRYAPKKTRRRNAATPMKAPTSIESLLST
jgi:hypothetical protein